MHQITRKNLLTWLIPTLGVAILIPLIIFICFSQCFRKEYVDGETNVAFSIGNFKVAWYGMFYFFGFTCAIFMSCFKMWKVYKIPVDPFYWYCLMAIPISILGGRMWSCVIGDAGWNTFFDFRGGGMAIEGGVMLTVILGLIYFPLVLKRPNFHIRDELGEPIAVRQISMWLYADAIVPTILIGQIIGRYGNYMNQEVYGAALHDGAWKDFVQNLFPYMTGVTGSTTMSAGITYQPLFLIESFANFWGLIFIYFVLEFIPKKKAGDLCLAYFLWYGILRAILNPMRDSQFGFHAWSVTISVLWAVAGAIFLVLNHTTFLKMRKYYCMYIIWEWIRYVFSRNKQRWQNVKNDKMRKPTEMLYYFGR